MIIILRELGLLNPLSGLLDILIVTVIMWLIIYFMSKILKSFPEMLAIDGKINAWERMFYRRLLIRYPIWGFTQQLVVILIYVGLNYLFPDGKYFMNRFIVLVLFTIAHFPNPLLMFVAPLITAMFIDHFNIYQNIYVLGISHGVLATTLMYFIPPKIHTSFSIWRNYWRYYHK